MAFEIVEDMSEDAYANYHLGIFNEEPYFFEQQSLNAMAGKGR